MGPGAGVKCVYLDAGKQEFFYAAQETTRLRQVRPERTGTITTTENAIASTSHEPLEATLKTSSVNFHSVLQAEKSSHVLPGNGATIPRGVDWLSLPAPYWSLLDYFLNAIASSSCHASVRHEFCSTLVTMALETSPLLAAVLNLAAVHRKTAGHNQSMAQLAHLQGPAVM